MTSGEDDAFALSRQRGDIFLLIFIDYCTFAINDDVIEFDTVTGRAALIAPGMTVERR